MCSVTSQTEKKTKKTKGRYIICESAKITTYKVEKKKLRKCVQKCL